MAYGWFRYPLGWFGNPWFGLGGNLSTKLDIYNMALSMLGEATITSLTANTKAVSLLNSIYTLVRDDCLRDHHWNFATLREALTEDTATPAFGYAHQFVMPVACLKLISTDPEEAVYELENNLLLTDEDTISIRYVSRVTQESVFDVKFTQFFATRLAAKICYNLTASASREEGLYALAAKELAGAKAVDGQEDSIKEFFAETWIESRY